jgi:hypothetical protein
MCSLLISAELAMSSVMDASYIRNFPDDEFDEVGTKLSNDF